VDVGGVPVGVGVLVDVRVGVFVNVGVSVNVGVELICPVLRRTNALKSVEWLPSASVSAGYPIGATTVLETIGIEIDPPA
jgi:hypothetical protein